MAEHPATAIPNFSVHSTLILSINMGVRGATKNTVRWYIPRITPIRTSDTPNELASLKVKSLLCQDKSSSSWVNFKHLKQWSCPSLHNNWNSWIMMTEGNNTWDKKVKRVRKRCSQQRLCSTGSRLTIFLFLQTRFCHLSSESVVSPHFEMSW